MSDRLCVIYEVRSTDESSVISHSYFSKKRVAMAAAKSIGRRVYKLEVSMKGGLRESVCRLVKNQGWVLSRELLADYRKDGNPEN